MRNQWDYAKGFGSVALVRSSEDLCGTGSLSKKSSRQRKNIGEIKDPAMMSRLYRQIGEKLKEYRKKSGISRDAVCGALGISPAMLFKLEKGDTRFPLEWLMLFCRVYEVSLHELLPEECFYAGLKGGRTTPGLFELILDIEALPPRKRAAFVRAQRERLQSA